MAYKTLIRDVSVLKPVGEYRAANGDFIALEHESVTYEEPGTLIPDRDVSPVVVRAYDSGDPHVLRLLEKVEEDKPAPKARAKKVAEETTEE